MTATAWQVLFGMNVVLLVLLGISWPFQAPGSPARVVTLFALAVIAVSLVGLGVVIRVDWNPFG
ncbi:hypothetical protein HUG10_16945 [Halorarum halophilum]|uniref:Uncharacterized protein n=1 Tax=Halorarum halophilum TaxID=2743090 RepID=A0A7D5H2E2_9EURY|nr:hypothetical protein [Halobaculum halophilum]QLG29113.1 hypothetical protein HUG10_16945 [Halobaculum halophilum]